MRWPSCIGGSGRLMQASFLRAAFRLLLLGSSSEYIPIAGGRVVMARCRLLLWVSAADSSLLLGLSKMAPGLIQLFCGRRRASRSVTQLSVAAFRWHTKVFSGRLRVRFRDPSFLPISFWWSRDGFNTRINTHLELFWMVSLGSHSPYVKETNQQLYHGW